MVSIAFAGKGGAGKTTLAATLARLCAQAGRRVVAVDADTNPNLAPALGIDRGYAPAFLPPSLVSRRLGGSALTQPVDDVVARFSVAGPDGVRVVHLGMPAHAEEGCMCSGHATVRALLHDLAEHPDILTVVDLEASPEHLSRGTARDVHVLLLVAEPYYRSLESVRRMAVLARELGIPRIAVVANKVRSEADAQALAEFCARHDLPQAGTVPWSDAVGAADRALVPLVEHPDAAQVVRAVEDLAAFLAAPARS